MCGIAGFVSAILTNGNLHAMLGTMVARGPDGAGEFHEGPIHMGMRRLSVIDLEHGSQPLYARGKSVVVFQNGEIYNYKGLRRRLEEQGYIFLTESDTEILAHGYAAWGFERLLREVDGMFAIAILDRSIKRLFLARDRFGEKPLFFCASSRGFAYASNLLSLSAMPWVSEDWDERSLDNYLTMHFVPGRRTMFRDIQQVLPGEMLELDVEELSLSRRRYYTPDPTKPPASEKILRETLEEAVTSRLVADVPVGVFLSGGLDSSVIAAIAARAQPGIKTFSVGFKDQSADESRYAEVLARHIGSDHRCLNFDQDAFFHLLPKVAEVLDTPIGDQALLPVFWLAREASQYVKVVLAGEGADEVFAGYGYYRQFRGTSARARLRTWLRRVGMAEGKTMDSGRLVQERTACLRSGFPILMGAEERGMLLDGFTRDVAASVDQDEWEEELVKGVGRLCGPLLRATMFDLRVWLPDDLLVKFDRMAMAHGLEGRAPFLHPRLVEAGLGLEEKRRMDASTSKVALRHLARQYIPVALSEREKHGFILPMSRWLGMWFVRHGGAQSYFADRPLPGLHAEDLVRVVEEDIKRGIKRERLVFALVMLAEWWYAFERARRELKSKFHG